MKELVLLSSGIGIFGMGSIGQVLAGIRAQMAGFVDHAIAMRGVGGP